MAPADLHQLQQEALHRWFRPPEIAQILRNHSNYNVHSQPPLSPPPAGSLFLFDRKVLRYFRKDGYNWRKKKDGKTVNEAHEKLKVSGVDALNCYYARSQENENFHRRIYWLLDIQLEHIVLVHYREINEGYKIGLSSLLTAREPGSQLGSPETSFASLCGNISSCVQASNKGPGFIDGSYISSVSSLWVDVHRSSGIVENGKLLHFDQQKPSDDLSRKLIDSRLDVDGAMPNVSDTQDGLFSDTQDVVQVVGKHAELNKSDSFRRWMDKEIGKDCDDSLMALNTNKDVSTLSHHMLLDTDSVGPSLSQEQLFSISDIAPVWVYCGSETKVLITGIFLRAKNSSDKWCCMFGESEVACDVMSENVIRCQVPHQAPGRVPFYLTCGNRLACSEIREFEFLKNPTRFASPLDTKISLEDISMQIRLGKLLCLDVERKWLDCSALECEKCKVKSQLCTLQDGMEKATCRNFKDIVIQDLLKDKLYEWLVCKAHEGDKAPHVLNDEGQGVIHLTASLGYVWAFDPIISAGVSPNFRDKQGRTSLHWASYFGREEAVIALMKLGAAAGAVDDPTPEFLGGRKAADMASERGHKGIAGYLAEADITTHLHSMSLTDDDYHHRLGTPSEDFVPTKARMDEDPSLKGPLSAIRKSVEAAAMIQSALRAHSFRLRQCRNGGDVLPSDLVSLAAGASSNKVQKAGPRCLDDCLHSSAIRIQKKYRGWKGRKDLLRKHNRIVRIQAHVRGRRGSMQYKKVIWSVSIIEKAILRWRRKRPGLRGFQTEKEASGSEQLTNEYDYLRVSRKLKVAGVEKALARVQSMVRHPEARDQYMRLVRLRNLKR